MVCRRLILILILVTWKAGKKEGKKEGRRREGGEQVRRSSRLREVEAQETQKKARRPSNSPHVFRAVSRLLKMLKLYLKELGRGGEKVVVASKE